MRGRVVIRNRVDSKKEPAPTPIRVRATKTDRARRHDVVVIEQAGRVRVLEAWRQGFLPHEIVHAAIEKASGLRGFIRLVAAGRAPGTITNETIDREALVAEALTNAFQYELAGLVERGNAGVRELVLDLFAREVANAPELDDEVLDRCRALLLELTRRWAALAPGESVELVLDA